MSDCLHSDVSSSSSSDPRPAVFLSYAHEDAAAARQLATALRAGGIEVWFDENELRGGDAWDRAIRKQIRDCTLFLPVVSASTQARPEGYFRLEWHLAEQRSLTIAKGRPFIVPVCVDATPDRDALVPDAFLAVQWTRPTSEEQLTQFVARVQALLTQSSTSSRQSSGAAVGVAEAARPGSSTAATNQPKVADYELLRVIGRGSYGDVWLARGATGLYRAIKIVWRERFDDGVPFEREWRGLKEFAAISLGESLQMALLHIGRNDEAGYFYYVMELADDAERGRDIDATTYVPLTLTERRARKGRLPASECIAYGVELARMLAGLHRRGLVHRDIKPSNIILVGGVPKLADIGLVANVATATTFVGTEGFVPPEGPGSPAADVYALGKVLYELSTGLDRQDFPRLPENVNALPDRRALFELNEIILRACDPVRDSRHHSADGLLAELLVVQGGHSLRRRRIGRLALRYVAAAAAIAVLGAGVVFGWKKISTPPRAATTVSTAPAAAPQIDRSIAVLPFENLSEDKESAYLANGLHGEILSGLTQIAQLRVIPRTTVEQYRAAKKPLGQIAKELGVAYILEGSVQRDQDRVVLAGRLFRAVGDQLVWADKFQRALADVFALQSELSGTIAAKLQAVIAPKELAALAQPPTKSTEAYQLFLKASDLFARDFIYTSGKEIQDLVEQAVTLDPDFTRAWQDLAEHAMTRYFMGKARSPAQLEKVRAAIDQCMRLAPEAARTLAIVGFYYYQIRGEYPKALEYVERALKLEPNVPAHHISLALVLRRQGKWIESTAELRHAVKLDPNDLESLRMLAMNMNYTRRFVEVIEINSRIDMLRPDLPKDRWGTATTTYFLTGSTRELDARIAALTPKERESPRGLKDQQDVALWKGDFAEAIRLDALLFPPEARGKEGSPYLVTMALVLAANGNMTAARARLGDRPKGQREGLSKGGLGAVEAGGGWARLAQMEALLGNREAAIEAWDPLESTCRHASLSIL